MSYDVAKIRDITERALRRLAIEDPVTEAVLRAAVKTAGQDALAIQAWPDGIATVAACGLELWRGPIGDVQGRPDA